MFILHDSNKLKYFRNKLWSKQGTLEKLVVKSQCLSFSVAVLTLPACHLCAWPSSSLVASDSSAPWECPLNHVLKDFCAASVPWLHLVFLLLPDWNCIGEECELALIKSSYTGDTSVLMYKNLPPYEEIWVVRPLVNSLSLYFREGLWIFLPQN